MLRRVLAVLDAWSGRRYMPAWWGTKWRSSWRRRANSETGVAYLWHACCTIVAEKPAHPLAWTQTPSAEESWMRNHPTARISHDIEHGIESARRGTSALTVVVVGALAALSGVLAGGGVAGTLGHVAGDEDTPLRLATWGTFLVAVLTLSALGLQSAPRRAWTAFIGDMLGHGAGAHCS